MNNNENQSTLYSLVELLYMPMAFYVLVQFDKIDTPLRGALWLIIFALVQNEYLSIKLSSPKYNIWLYLSDIMSLFVYLLALRAIFNTKILPPPSVGYDPKFWIYISFLWLSYAIWNCFMIRTETDIKQKANWRRWRNGMFTCFGITLLCGVALTITVVIPTSQQLSILTSILHVLLFGCVAWALVGWWLKDYFSHREREQLAKESDVV